MSDDNAKKVDDNTRGLAMSLFAGKDTSHVSSSINTEVNESLEKSRDPENNAISGMLSDVLEKKQQRQVVDKNIRQRVISECCDLSIMDTLFK